MAEKQVVFGVVPSKSNSYRIVRINNASRIAKSKSVTNYEDSFILQCTLYRNANIETDFNFYMDVFYPSRRSDIDGSLKVVLDCLQKVNAIKNDNLCQKIVVRKFLDKSNPRVEFVIIPI
jgi:Holliday junction resolvase RusA-like endonuclease